jgi:predicted RNA-binding Zn-ribbon protein involved in translation (DUF1610 family)
VPVSGIRVSQWQIKETLLIDAALVGNVVGNVMVARKVNLEKVQASLDAVCPKCGKAISPAEVRRVDFERIECPLCGERFALT